MMKIKKQLLIFAALMILLMGAASATDVSDDTTDTTSMAEETVQQTQTATDINNIATQDNREKDVKTDTNTENGATATQSIQKNTNKANTKEDTTVTNWEKINQTITRATEDTTITLQDNITNTRTIRLDKPGITITIDGNGTTINGAQTQVFYIHRGSSLILKNITITNSTSDWGGAIQNWGTLNITHTTLTNNTGTDGGAINNYGTLTITNTTIQNNTATRDGGAIYNGETLNITHSTLNNNTADHDGGAIHNHPYGTLTITDSTLNNNTAADDGGAIENVGTLNITDSTLTNNTANHDGGAIENDNGGTLTITHTTLQNNTATYNGGAIHNYYLFKDVKFNVTETIFIQNHARSAGAIYSENECVTSIIINNTFTRNTAKDNETLVIHGEKTIEKNIYDSTDISLKTIKLTVKDNQKTFETSEDVELNSTIELKHREYYDDDILEKLNKTLYINGEENVTTTGDSYTLSNLKPGNYSLNYTSCNQQSNTVTFKVIGNSEITTPDDSYDYYDGIKNTVTLNITDPSEEKGTADIRVKDGDKYQELVSCQNVNDGYTLLTETLKNALENLYDGNLEDSYTINVTYISNNDYVTPSSTEFTLNIIKQRNTTITYDIINNTEGNVQINITVLDDIYKTPVPDATIKITGDIQQETTSGVITDTTLTPGDYKINVQYEENTDYKASTATIDFTVEIDKDKKITELENNITNITNQLEEKQKELKEANKLINTLNETNKKLTQKLEEAKEQITALTNTITNLNKEIKTLNDTANNLTEELKDANNEINSLNNDNDELTKELETANNKIQTLNNKINNLTKQLNNAEEEIENLNKIIDELINKKPLNTTITINPIKSSIGEITTLTANITTQNGNKITGGKAVFKVNGITLKDENNNVIYATVTDGTASINYKVQDVWMKNTSTVQAVYSGTEKYAEARTNASDVLDISKGKATITLEKETITAKAGQTITLKALILDVNNDRINTGKAVFKLNGKTLKDNNGETLYAYVKDGKATLDYTIPSIYSAKTYTLTAVYGGGNYERAETNGTLNLERKAVNINTDKITTKNNKTTIKATITDETGKLLVTNTKLAIKINQKTILNNITSTNGKIDVSFTLPLRPGMYELTIISGENGLYKKGTMTTVLKI